MRWTHPALQHFPLTLVLPKGEIESSPKRTPLLSLKRLILLGSFVLSLYLLIAGFNTYDQWREANQPEDLLFSNRTSGEVLPAPLRAADMILAPPAAAPADQRAAERMGPLLPPTRFVIPDLRLTTSVAVAGTGIPPRDKVVAWYAGSALPGAPGNLVLFGQASGPYQTLWRLNELKPREVLEVHTARGYWTYRLSQIRVVPSSAVDLRVPTAEPTLTVITEAGNKNLLTGQYPQRLVVTATLFRWTSLDQQSGLFAFLSKAAE